MILIRIYSVYNLMYHNKEYDANRIIIRSNPWTYQYVFHMLFMFIYVVSFLILNDQRMHDHIDMVIYNHLLSLNDIIIDVFLYHMIWYVCVYFRGYIMVFSIISLSYLL